MHQTRRSSASSTPSTPHPQQHPSLRNISLLEFRVSSSPFHHHSGTATATSVANGVPSSALTPNRTRSNAVFATSPSEKSSNNNPPSTPQQQQQKSIGGPSASRSFFASLFSGVGNSSTSSSSASTPNHSGNNRNRQQNLEETAKKAAVVTRKARNHGSASPSPNATLFHHQYPSPGTPHDASNVHYLDSSNNILYINPKGVHQSNRQQQQQRKEQQLKNDRKTSYLKNKSSLADTLKTPTSPAHRKRKGSSKAIAISEDELQLLESPVVTKQRKAKSAQKPIRAPGSDIYLKNEHPSPHSFDRSGSDFKVGSSKTPTPISTLTTTTKPRHQRQRSLSNSLTSFTGYRTKRSSSFSSKSPSTPVAEESIISGAAANSFFSTTAANEGKLSSSVGVKKRKPSFNRNSTDINLFRTNQKQFDTHSYTASSPTLPSGGGASRSNLMVRSQTISELQSPSKSTKFMSSSWDNEHIKSQALDFDTEPNPLEDDSLRKRSVSNSSANGFLSSLTSFGNSKKNAQTNDFARSPLEHSPTSNLRSDRAKNQQKKFWMPDKSVNRCYDCQSVFTVFKRKHHCRVCGQIFCWKCSSNFVDGAKWNLSGRIRVCNLCMATDRGADASNILRERAKRDAADSPDQDETRRNSIPNSVSTPADSQHGGTGNAMMTQIGETPVFMSKSISNLSLFNPSEEAASNVAKNNNNADNRSSNAASVCEEQDDMNAATKEGASSAASSTQSAPCPPPLHISRVNTDGETLYTPLTANNTDRSTSSVSLISPAGISVSGTTVAQDNSSRMDIALTSPSARVGGPLNNGSFSPIVEVDSMESGTSRSKEGAMVTNINNNTATTSHPSSPKEEDTIHFDSVATIAEGDVYYSDSTEDELFSRDEFKAQEKPNRERRSSLLPYYNRTHSIIQHAQNHLKNLVSRLLLDEGISDKDTAEWLPILVRIAWKVVTTIRIDVNHGDGMDIRQYVNLKTIEVSKQKSVKNAEYINGVVFRGNVAHRHMRTQIKNPSILLLKAPIQFYRHPTRMTSFDVLMQQEYDYLTLLVERIAEHNPDIVFVHKSVSRVAQELLLKRGISLVSNIKMSVMKRISRVSQIPILNTVDELDYAASRNQLNPANPDERHIELTEERHIDYSKGRTKTLFVLRTRKQDTGGTVLLKSNDAATLKTVKSVLQFAIFVAYNVRLEAAFCVDSCGTFLSPEEEEQKRQAESEEEPQYELPYSSTPTKLLSLISTSMNISVPMYPDDLILQEEYENALYDHTAPQEDLPLFTSPYLHQNIVFLYSKIKKSSLSSGGNGSLLTGAKDSADSSIDALYVAPETVVIAYYTSNDMTLGQYLMSKCFQYSVVEESRTYSRSYAHNNGKLIVDVEQSTRHFTLPGTNHEVIMMWSFCKKCGRCVTPMVPMTAKTYNYSFGKFLEVVLYDNKLRCNTGSCNHLINRDHVRYFGFRDMVARFTYERVSVYEVVFPALQIEYNEEHERKCFAILTDRLMDQCNQLFQHYQTILCADEMVHLPSEVREDILAQQQALTEELKTKVADSNHVYVLNRFIRSLFIHAKDWNRTLHQYQQQANVFTSPTNSASNSSAQNNTTSSSGTLRVSNMIASVTPSKHKKKLRKKVQRSSAPCVTPLHLPHSRRISVRLHPSLNPEDGSEYISVEVSPHNPFVSADPSDSSNSPTPLSPSPTSPVAIPVIEDMIPMHMIHSGGDVFVYDNEPSSIIAYMLQSKEYQSALRASQKGKHVHARLLSREKYHIKQNISASKSHHSTSSNQDASSSRSSSKRHNSTGVSPNQDTTVASTPAMSINSPPDSESATALSPHESSISTSLPTLNTTDDMRRSVSMDVVTPRKQTPSETSSELTTSSGQNSEQPIAAQLSTSRSAELSTSESFPGQKSSTSKPVITCTSYYSQQFAALRQLCCGGDERFIRSLARCIEWKPTGGKSGSTFTKSWDDRFVIKHVPRVELLAFLETSNDYFAYMAKTLTEDDGTGAEQKKLPTVLLKILGVYKLSYMQGKKVVKQNVIVMENLFYNAQIEQVFDLKGSLRNRFQKQMNAVKLDENLLREMQKGYELVTRSSDKNRLTICIYNDTLFLSKLNVMDYSLLVGVDETKQRLLVGIIDYVRPYTWDKRVETLIKSTKMVGKKKVPTVISPKLYKSRFREASMRYFPCAVTFFTANLKTR